MHKIKIKYYKNKKTKIKINKNEIKLYLNKLIMNYIYSKIF